MRIGPYDPQGLLPNESNIPRPAAAKALKGNRAAAAVDDVSISAAARKLAAEGGSDRTEKSDGETIRPGKTERAAKRKDSGFYDRPEIKRDIARRIADEIVKDPSVENGNGKQNDNDDDSNRGS